MPLDEDEVRAAARELRDEGVEAVAVCFLFSYLNPRARAARGRDRARGDARRVRHDERRHRPAVPRVRALHDGDDERLRRPEDRQLPRRASRRRSPSEGVDGELHVMMSSGGVASVQSAAERPVTLLLSGPGGRASSAGSGPARSPGAARLITFDMGGTSADIGIVTEDGIAEASARDTWIGGYPLLVPMLDVHTIGAGGGSIAYVDEGGAFRVGPRSAGADARARPATGTAARSRRSATRTSCSGGSTPSASSAAACGSTATRPSRPVGAAGRAARARRSTETAEGILTIANSNMARAIRSRTIEKGHDPREFALVAFGGAGPLHAAEVADSLEHPRGARAAASRASPRPAAC